jgi:hypothetical protein
MNANDRFGSFVAAGACANKSAIAKAASSCMLLHSLQVVTGTLKNLRPAGVIWRWAIFEGRSLSPVYGSYFPSVRRLCSAPFSLSGGKSIRKRLPFLRPWSLSRKGAYVNARKLRPTEVDRSSSSKGLIIERPLARSRGFIDSNGPNWSAGPARAPQAGLRSPSWD